MLLNIPLLGVTEARPSPPTKHGPTNDPALTLSGDMSNSTTEKVIETGDEVEVDVLDLRVLVWCFELGVSEGDLGGLGMPLPSPPRQDQIYNTS